MARKFYLVAIFLMAGSIGVLGYQVLYYLIEGNWPSVPIIFVWEYMFGPVAPPRWPSLTRAWGWFCAVPVTAALMAMAYAVFLVSDTLRRR